MSRSHLSRLRRAAGRRPRAARGARAVSAPDHSRGGLADRGAGGGRLRRADGRRDLDPSTVTAAVLALAGELAEHLRGPGDVTRWGSGWPRRRRHCPAGCPAAVHEGPRLPADPRAAAADGRRRTAGQGRRGRSSTTATRWRWPPGSRTGIPRWARPNGPATRWCCSMSTRTPAMPSWCCCAHCSAAGTRSPPSATRASRSTAGAGRARATCAGSPTTSRPGRRRAGPEVRLLSTSFRNTGRVLDAAAAVQERPARRGAGSAPAGRRRPAGPAAARWSAR